MFGYIPSDDIIKIMDELDHSRATIEQEMRQAEDAVKRLTAITEDMGDTGKNGVCKVYLEKLDELKQHLERYLMLLEKSSMLCRGYLRPVCANCGKTYIEGDKYCRFCGAPMGEPLFIGDDRQCIYGPPPVKRIHKCAKCGFSWETCEMIDSARWCPECGGEAPGRDCFGRSYKY